MYLEAVEVMEDDSKESMVAPTPIISIWKTNCVPQDVSAMYLEAAELIEKSSTSSTKLVIEFIDRLLKNECVRRMRVRCIWRRWS